MTALRRWLNRRAFMRTWWGAQAPRPAELQTVVAFIRQQLEERYGPAAAWEPLTTSLDHCTLTAHWPQGPGAPREGALVKISVGENAKRALEREAYVHELLLAHGLPVPQRYLAQEVISGHLPPIAVVVWEKKPGTRFPAEPAPAQWRAMGHLLGRLHAIQQPTAIARRSLLDVRDERHYAGRVGKYLQQLDSLFIGVRRQKARARQYAAGRPPLALLSAGTQLLHHDYGPGNVVCAGELFSLIDYEGAAWGYGLFELAETLNKLLWTPRCWATHAKATPGNAAPVAVAACADWQLLVEGYFEGLPPPQAQLARAEWATHQHWFLGAELLHFVLRASRKSITPRYTLAQQREFRRQAHRAWAAWQQWPPLAG
jgi:hypothetical protein